MPLINGALQARYYADLTGGPTAVDEVEVFPGTAKNFPGLAAGTYTLTIRTSNDNGGGGTFTLADIEGTPSLPARAARRVCPACCGLRGTAVQAPCPPACHRTPPRPAHLPPPPRLRAALQ